MKVKLLLTLLSLSLLNGCATYFEQTAQNTCVNTQWYEEGFDTAKNGETKAKGWAEVNSECEKYNIWSDRKSFDNGYELGRTEFCTRSNGFEFGQRYNAYAPICRTDLQAAFDQAYDDGASLYHATYNLDQALESLANAESDVSEGRARRRYLKKQIKSGNLEKDVEKKYVKERYQLKSEISSARSSISGYKADITEFTREQSALEYRLFSKYYDNVDADVEYSGYSVDKTVRAQSTELNEPAVLLYKPENMDYSQKSHYKKLAKKINKYISSTVDRSFRYQVVGNIDLVFSPGTADESITSPANSFLHPALLLWDGKNELNSIELTPEINEPPLAELTRFVELIAAEKMLLADAAK